MDTTPATHRVSNNVVPTIFKIHFIYWHYSMCMEGSSGLITARIKKWKYTLDTTRAIHIVSNKY